MVSVWVSTPSVSPLLAEPTLSDKLNTLLSDDALFGLSYIVDELYPDAEPLERDDYLSTIKNEINDRSDLYTVYVWDKVLFTLSDDPKKIDGSPDYFDDSLKKDILFQISLWKDILEKDSGETADLKLLAKTLLDKWEPGFDISDIDKVIGNLGLYTKNSISSADRVKYRNHLMGKLDNHSLFVEVRTKGSKYRSPTTKMDEALIDQALDLDIRTDERNQVVQSIVIKAKDFLVDEFVRTSESSEMIIQVDTLIDQIWKFSTSSPLLSSKQKSVIQHIPDDDFLQEYIEKMLIDDDDISKSGIDVDGNLSAMKISRPTPEVVADPEHAVVTSMKAALDNIETNGNGNLTTEKKKELEWLIEKRDVHAFLALKKTLDDMWEVQITWVTDQPAMDIYMHTHITPWENALKAQAKSKFDEYFASLPAELQSDLWGKTEVVAGATTFGFVDTHVGKLNKGIEEVYRKIMKSKLEDVSGDDFLIPNDIDNKIDKESIIQWVIKAVVESVMSDDWVRNKYESHFADQGMTPLRDYTKNTEARIAYDLKIAEMRAQLADQTPNYKAGKWLLGRMGGIAKAGTVDLMNLFFKSKEKTEEALQYIIDEGVQTPWLSLLQEVWIAWDIDTSEESLWASLWFSDMHIETNGPGKIAISCNIHKESDVLPKRRSIAWGNRGKIDILVSQIHADADLWMPQKARIIKTLFQQMITKSIDKYGTLRIAPDDTKSTWVDIRNSGWLHTMLSEDGNIQIMSGNEVIHDLWDIDREIENADMLNMQKLMEHIHLLGTDTMRLLDDKATALDETESYFWAGEWLLGRGQKSKAYVSSQNEDGSWSEKIDTKLLPTSSDKYTLEDFMIKKVWNKECWKIGGYIYIMDLSSEEDVQVFSTLQDYMDADNQDFTLADYTEASLSVFAMTYPGHHITVDIDGTMYDLYQKDWSTELSRNVLENFSDKSRPSCDTLWLDAVKYPNAWKISINKQRKTTKIKKKVTWKKRRWMRAAPISYVDQTVDTDVTYEDRELQVVSTLDNKNAHALLADPSISRMLLNHMQTSINVGM